jgi:integrase
VCADEARCGGLHGNTLRESWGPTKLDGFSPIGFQKWLKDLDAKPKTKGHRKAFVTRLFNKATLYGMLDFHENPIGLVEVRGISKRSRKPADLTVDQFSCFWVFCRFPTETWSGGAM